MFAHKHNRLSLSRAGNAALPSLGGALVVAAVLAGNYWNVLTSEPAPEPPAVADRLERLRADEARIGEASGDLVGSTRGLTLVNALPGTLPGGPPGGPSDASTPGSGRDGASAPLVARSVVLTRGETLGRALERLTVSRRDATGAVNALSQRRDPRLLRAGDSVRGFFDAGGTLQRLVVAGNSGTASVTVRREGTSSGGGEATEPAVFVSESGGEAGDLAVHEVVCHIHGALPAALQRCGEDPSLAAVVAPVLSWSLDLYTDLQTGDELRAIVEKFQDGDRFVRYGRLLALQYKTDKRSFRAFRYRSVDGTDGFYDENGRSVERTFLRSPLKAAHVSSGFSHHRMHPILHRVQAHLGVDYLAPVGTPVWAVADGIVTHASRSGAAGNRVALKHETGLSTEYMHLSRYAPGITAGKHIKQGHTIGYVGSTGRSTGPHLHFAVKKGGEFLNPSKVLEGLGGPGIVRNHAVEGAELDSLRQAIAPFVERFDRRGAAPLRARKS